MMIPLTYKSNKMSMKKSLLLIALLCPLWLFAQSEGDYRTVKGVVMDSVTNETLIGATVMIDPNAVEAKNLGPKGTITDLDGKFELKIPKAVKYVVVSFVGYKNTTLDVTKNTEFKVLLQPDQEQLGEVELHGKWYDADTYICDPLISKADGKTLLLFFIPPQSQLQI